MAFLAERLVRPGLRLLRRTPERTIPIPDRPELQAGGKGYLYLAAAHVPDNPAQTSALGTLPEMLRIKALDVNSKNPNLTDFILWNPTVVDMQLSRFSRLSNSAEAQANAREDYLRKCGYRDFKTHSYPDRLVQIAIRKPARPVTPPVARTSR